MSAVREDATAAPPAPAQRAPPVHHRPQLPLLRRPLASMDATLCLARKLLPARSFRLSAGPLAPSADPAAVANGSGRSACPPHVLAAIYGRKTREQKQADLDASLNRWGLGGLAWELAWGATGVCQPLPYCAHVLVPSRAAPGPGADGTCPSLPRAGGGLSTRIERTTRIMSMWPTACCTTATTCRARPQPPTACRGLCRLSSSSSSRSGRRARRRKRTRRRLSQPDHATADSALGPLAASGTLPSAPCSTCVAAMGSGACLYDLHDLESAKEASRAKMSVNQRRQGPESSPKHEKKASSTNSSTNRGKQESLQAPPPLMWGQGCHSSNGLHEV